jgi:ferredoxin-NADP reductase
VAGESVVVFDDDETEELHASVGDAADRGEVYVFGFSDFCKGVRDALEGAGVDSGDAHIESFG